ncbi:hypothetical protein BCO71171_06067 [Burkholderia contaminans]|uniref:RES domain-containing protein n=2 Tax=Burkholderia contaminans TaxID=488447 RepID=A0A6P3BK83_9BURK|nr:hypothetical protein BCO71171_06067 [Burkholderia contaminans]
MFYRDIESGWNADHLYCDECFDEFVAEWPLAYSVRNAELQRAGIDLNTFYSGSRLGQVFTKADYDRLIVQLSCPNCGTPLRGNFWPYHLPFDAPPTFVSDVQEVGELAKRAPFLLLSHPLSRKVFELVKRVAADAPVRVVNDRLFRARTVNASVSEDIACFDFPPADVVSEGRYNHAGRPVLYLASSFKTCIAELRNTEAIVASFSFTKPLKIFDLLDIDTFEGEDHNLMGALTFSALISAPQNGEGWSRPAYVFTRFFADCATLFGFDAIRYPSTRLSDQDGSYNLVLLQDAPSLRSAATEISYQTHRPQTNAK